MKTERNQAKSRTVLRLVAAALACSALVACSSTPKGQSQNTYVGGEGREMETRVGNRGFQGELEILRPITRRNDDGRLHVQFELHNKKTRDLAFEYAITWRDADDFVVETPWHWTPMSIVGQGFRTISVTAPTPEANQWELHVQKPSSVR